MKKTVSIFAVLLGLVLTGCSSMQTTVSSDETTDLNASFVISLDDLPNYNETDHSVTVPEETPYVTFESALDADYETVTIELTYKFTTTKASFYVWHAASDESPLFPADHTIASAADLDTWITTTITADLTDARKLVFELLGEGTKIKLISVTPL